MKCWHCGFLCFYSAWCLLRFLNLWVTVSHQFWSITHFLFNHFFCPILSLLFSLNSSNMNDGHLIRSQMSFKVCFVLCSTPLSYSLIFTTLSSSSLFISSMHLVCLSSECFNSDTVGFFQNIYVKLALWRDSISLLALFILYSFCPTFLLISLTYYHCYLKALISMPTSVPSVCLLTLIKNHSMVHGGLHFPFLLQTS